MEMDFYYDEGKDAWLKHKRGIGFEEIIALIEEGVDYDIADHPNPARYPRQKYLLIVIEGQVWSVPVLIEENKVVMKTAFPNRKLTKQWKKEGKL